MAGSLLGYSNRLDFIEVVERFESDFLATAEDIAFNEVGEEFRKLVVGMSPHGNSKDIVHYKTY
jgi:hypothetical protein